LEVELTVSARKIVKKNEIYMIKYLFICIYIFAKLTLCHMSEILKLMHCYSKWLWIWKATQYLPYFLEILRILLSRKYFAWNLRLVFGVLCLNVVNKFIWSILCTCAHRFVQERNILLSYIVYVYFSINIFHVLHEALVFW